MLSKEEIEKAKDVLNNFKLLFLKNIKENTDTYICNHYTKVFRDNIETLLQYTKQLEQENNKESKMIDEMAKYIKEPYQLYIFKGRMSKITAIKQYFEKEVEGK